VNTYKRGIFVIDISSKDSTTIPVNPVNDHNDKFFVHTNSLARVIRDHDVPLLEKAIHK
ncbi:7957_t:CDS:2, partial [Gigaspora rosea]